MESGKGIAIDIIGIVLIGLIGVIVLLIFVQGPLSSLLKGTFCYFYQNVLQQKSDFCRKPIDQTEFVTISATTPEDLARNIAAYSIVCWKEINPTVKKDIACFNLILDKNPGDVDEYLVTNILEKEKGCTELQNSKIIDMSGNQIDYAGDCGAEDQIVWDVSGNIISTQKLILIKYDLTTNKIVIKA